MVEASKVRPIMPQPEIMNRPENLERESDHLSGRVRGQFSATESDVLTIAENWLSQGRRVALATVVKTTGSAPRQGGSHIAVRDDGAFAGSVSAGCVENAVIELALAAMQDGKNRSQGFGLSDGVFAPGLLCGGQIEILIEPIF